MHDAELYSWDLYKDSQGLERLRGIIKNDRAGRWIDGRRIFTSPIVSSVHDTATTQNTTYKLMGEWRGPWTHRTLEDKIKEEVGPVHFNIVRW